MNGPDHGQKLHHIGFVVGSISEVAKRFAQSVRGTWDGKIIHDPLQQVRVSFICCCVQIHPLIELVEEAAEGSPVSDFLKRGGGLHHLCFEVENLENQLERILEEGSLMAKKPLPAAAFNGRRIAWIYTPERLLVEYLER